MVLIGEGSVLIVPKIQLVNRGHLSRDHHPPQFRALPHLILDGPCEY